MNTVKENSENRLTPGEYFDIIKDKKNKVTDKELSRIYDNCLALLNKCEATGQTRVVEKLAFHLETIEKEKEIIKSGIDTFVYRDDIEHYIDNVANDVVKITELEDYEREIPDHVVENLKKVKEKFNKFYVVFTDYTGSAERKVAKERREKDPILFATFEEKETATVIDRFYFIGDWVDEYCDLTLDKMVNETKKEKSKDIEMKIKTPEDIKELREQLSRLRNVDDRFVMENPKKKGFIEKVKTFFKRG